MFTFFTFFSIYLNQELKEVIMKLRLFMFFSLLKTPFLLAQTYKIGVEDLNYFPVYAFGQEKKGYSYEILELFAQKEGIKFEYVILPVKRLYKYFMDEKVDFKFPDHPTWKKDEKKGKTIIYSNPAIEYIDGVLVKKENKEKKEIQTLGTLLGFTPWDYLQEIQEKKIKLFENSDFSSLLQGVMKESIEGAYLNIEVGFEALEKLGASRGDFAFNPFLKHTQSHYHLSSIKHKDIINKFNTFLIKEEENIKNIIKKYKK